MKTVDAIDSFWCDHSFLAAHRPDMSLCDIVLIVCCAIFSADAIMRGLLKARKLDDPNTLDIDDENKMVLDKTGSKKVTSQQAAAASSQTKVNGH